MKALKWQLMQSKLSENFRKWCPYLELFWGYRGEQFQWGAAAPLASPRNRPCTDQARCYLSFNAMLLKRSRTVCCRNRPSSAFFSAINNCIWTGNVVSVDEAADVITIMCRTASTGRPDHTESVGLHWLDDQPRCNHSYGCRQLQSDVRRATICRDRYLANRGGPVLQRRNRLIRTDRGLYRSTDWRERTQSILLRREMDDFRSLWLWDR